MKKKVLIFIPEFPVLTETFIEREIYGLIKSKKFDISIVSLYKNSEYRHKYLEQVTEYKRLTISDVIGGLRYIILRPIVVFNLLKTLGVKRLYLLIKSLGYTYIFSKYFPDIIYAHFLSVPSTIAYIAAQILDIPYGISAHARDVLEYPDLPQIKANSAKFITFCNRNAYEKAKTLWGSETNNFHLSYHGLVESDLEINPEDNSLKLCPNTIFCIGRLTEKKGIEYLINASIILKEKGIPHCIYVAGGGSLYEKYSQIIKKNNLYDNFILLGNVEFKSLVKYLNRCAIYVQPSIDMSSGDSDGIPNGLIEAAMLKKPIITTNAGSISEFIDQSTGVVVPQRDAKALAEAIIYLIENESKRIELANNAYNKAHELFEFSSAINRICNFLSEKN